MPFGHWNAITFVGALRHDGIIAPWVINGSINGASFRTYVEQVFAPELRPDDIVVMDNLGSQRALPSARRSGLQVRKSSSSPPIPQISTPSNRSSQNSNTSCERPQNAPKKPSGAGSDHSSTLSPRKSAKTKSEMQDAVPCKVIPLYGQGRPENAPFLGFKGNATPQHNAQIDQRAV
jgi:hypothetical protein